MFLLIYYDYIGIGLLRLIKVSHYGELVAHYLNYGQKELICKNIVIYKWEIKAMKFSISEH